MIKDKPMKKKNTTTSARKIAVRSNTPTRRPKKRLRKYTLHYILLTVFLLAVVVVLSRTVLFKSEKIVVVNNEKYSDQEIINTSQLKLDENMFSMKFGSSEDKILKKYPYIQSVKFKRKLPHTIEIVTKMVEPMGAILMSDGYTIVSKEGKVIEKGVMKPPNDVMIVRGLADMQLELGKIYKLSQTEEFTMLKYFVEALEYSGLENIMYVNLSDIYNIKALYDDRILLSFGTEDDLAYKMKKAEQLVLCKEEYKNFEGIIDISMSNEARVRKKPISDILVEDLGETPPQQIEETPLIIYTESTIAESVKESSSIALSNEILNKHLEERKQELNPKLQKNEKNNDGQS